MSICRDCRLSTTDGDDTSTDGLCRSCQDLRKTDSSLHVSRLSRNDLELVMAWRSNPVVYEYARQQDGPLAWDEHISWYESRESERYDFVVHYRGRQVGVVSIDSADEVSIYLGDLSARGNGVATAALTWLCDRFDERSPLYAEVNIENEASQSLFERCEFERKQTEDGWNRFVYDD